MLIGAGIVFVVIGVVGLLTSQTPEGPVANFDNAAYLVLIAAGAVLALFSWWVRSKNKR